MNREEALILQGLQIELSKITLTLNELKAATIKKTKYDNLPAWINIDMAAKLKGGCSVDWIKNTLCLQPCCGTNYQLIGGRKSWRLDDVIEWLDIADSGLKKYAEKWGVLIPEKYERRSA